ncbi:MAG: hypothetical protein ABIF19_19755 [Planctomycetota bacterium]
MESSLLFCRSLLLCALALGILTACIGGPARAADANSVAGNITEGPRDVNPRENPEADSGADVLQFRIAPAKVPSSRAPSRLTEDDIARAREDLISNGPLASISRDDEFVWFEMMPGVKGPEFLITEEYQGVQYLLVHNWVPFVIWPGTDWGLERVSKGKDNNGRTCVQLQFNREGANLFYSLTGANVGRHLAIIVDGKVASASNIMTAIRSFAVIPGDFTEGQIEDMIKVLQKAVLPALTPPPAPKAIVTYLVPGVLFILVVSILVLFIYR